MAIEFTYRGQKFRVDTPEEVTKLKEHLDAEAREDEKYMSEDERFEERLRHTKWSPDRFVTLVDNIGYQQKQFLAALLSKSGSISAEETREALGLNSLMVLAGVQSGLVRKLREIGLEPYDLYRVHIDWKEGDRVRYFTIDDGFRMVAAEEEWPPATVQLVKKRK